MYHKKEFIKCSTELPRASIKGYKNILLLTWPSCDIGLLESLLYEKLISCQKLRFQDSLDIVRWTRTAITFVETAKKLVLGNRQGKQKCGSLSI
jgi:hypothetical protein